MPSPSESMEQVSTQTRSPMPTCRIFVTVNGTRPTLAVEPFTRAATDRTTAGSVVFSRMPYTPFSRTWRASSASFTFFTVAMIWSDWATRFSSGMTVQSLVVTITFFPFPIRAAAFSLSLSVMVHSAISVPGLRSPSGAMVVILPSLRTSSARSTTRASAPLSMAVVATSLFQGRTSTQNCFIRGAPEPLQGPRCGAPPGRGPGRMLSCPRAGTRSSPRRPRHPRPRPSPG